MTMQPLPFEATGARWSLRPQAPLAELQRLSAELGVAPELAQMAWGRGVDPQLLNLPHRVTPNSGLREAARRLAGLRGSGKRLRIHGDYDADGVTATTVLVRGLRALGYQVHGFIPHRLEDGYGINMKRVPEHAEAADVFITVDCGVSNLQEVARLVELGVEVIVTDHHAPGAEYPDVLVVHPQLTEGYDERLHVLTGAGVAYHLLWALHEELGLPEPEELLPVAALGTIADVAPLLGENRSLVSLGLQQFARTGMPGLLALMGESAGKVPSARDVAFQFAPRINAAGRLGSSQRAFELLMSDDVAEAEQIAGELELLNRQRREIQDQILEQALAQVDESERIIVVSDDSWHPGVMGIVAAKLLERYWRPVYIVSQGKGSARSTPGISAVGGLRHAAEALQKFGGHPGAAGFSLDMARLPLLRERLQDYALSFPEPREQVVLDGPLPVFLDLEAFDLQQALEPYGKGHEAPRWHWRGVLGSPRLVGRNADALQFSAAGLRGVIYGQEAVTSGEVDLSLSLRLNSWNGRTSLEVLGEGLRRAAPLAMEATWLRPSQAERQLSRVSQASPREALRLVEGGQAGWYASGAAAEYLHGMASLPLSFEAPFPARVVVFSPSPGELLRAWLEAGCQLSFCFTPKVQQALGRGELGWGEGLDSEAYHARQWHSAYALLDAGSFAVAVLCFAGLGLPLG